MSTKVKGDKIKENSIPFNALAPLNDTDKNQVLANLGIKTPFQIYKDNGGKLFTNESAYYEYLAARDTHPASISGMRYIDLDIFNTNEKWKDWDFEMKDFASLMTINPHKMCVYENEDDYDGIEYIFMDDGSPWNYNEREHCLSTNMVNSDIDKGIDIYINPNNKKYKTSIY